MKQYIGTKVINAKPMTRGDYTTGRGLNISENENYEDAGYNVFYSDGYESWSSADVFEDVYRPMEDMTFGIAIEALKKGMKVARKGWNGKGMFLYLTAGSVVQCDKLKPETHKSLENLIGTKGIDNVIINSHIDMKAADDSIVIGWLASQIDMLAEDWYIVEQ